MNAPVLLAQLTGASQQSSATPAKNIKVEKPQNGQAVTVHLDGQSKIDFSDIASEKLTFVRIGDRLIILFDNQSTVSIDPVFANNGSPLPEVTFEMGPDRVLNGDQFAGLFPITTDQSVLPAAGTPGAPGVPAGANFGNFTVDPLTVGTPLALLGAEGFGGNVSDVRPASTSTPIPGTPDTVILNEDGLSEGLPGGPGDTGGTLTSFTGSLHIDFGTDFIGRSLAFAATQPGLAGLTSGGQEVHLQIATVGGHPELIAYVGDDPSVVANRVFTITLDADTTIDGTYTVTLLRPLDHPVQGTEDTLSLTVGIIAIDGSGDSAPVSLVINVNDDSPTATPVESTSVAEHAGGEGGFVPTTETVALGIAWGADNGNSKTDGGSNGTVVDGDRSLVFAASEIATLNALNLTSNGDTVHYALSPNGTEIVATARHGEEGALRTIFTVSLSDTGSGSYTFTLSDNIDHNGDNNLSQPLTFNVVATDADGDPVATAFTVNISDDVPTFGGETPSAPVLDEGGLQGGNPDTGYPGDVPGAIVEDGGSLGVRWGADDANNTSDGGVTGSPVVGDRSVTFAYGTGADQTLSLAQASALISVTGGNGAIALDHLTSDGVPLQFVLSANGTVITAYQGATHDAVHEVFTVSLSDQGPGSYDFTLTGNLDHPITGTEDNLTFSFKVVATDSDGDTASSSFSVIVNDDAPTFGERVTFSRVDEDGLGNPGNTYDDNNDAPGANLAVTDYLGIRWGADNANSNVDGGIGEGLVKGDRAVTFASDVTTSLVAQHLTSNGVGLTYTVSQNGTVLTAYRYDSVHHAYIDGNGHATSTAADAAVFKVSLSDQGQGSYTFTLIDNLDHPVRNTEDDITLKFGFVATDSDGDARANSFTIKVNDDAPVAHAGTGGSVNEADLVDSGGRDCPPAFGWQGHEPSVSGALNIAWGADNANPTSGGGLGDRFVAFTAANVHVSAGEVALSGLTSNGQTVHYAFDHGVLVGYTGNSGLAYGDRVFEVALSDAGTGSYTFTLLGNLDHPTGGGTNALNLTFGYTATDSDGDSSASTFTVSVVDSVPTIGKPEYETVSEANLPTDWFDTTFPDSPYSTVQTGQLAISWGADDNDSGVTNNRSVAFTTTTAPSGLSSDGFAISYSLLNDGTTLIATSSDHRTVFTISLNDDGDGSYKFTLYDNIDHHGTGADSLPLTFGFVATDSDGDTATSNFQVSIIDSVPTIGCPEDETVSEANLPTTSYDTSNPDAPNSTVQIGNLDISWGADDNNSGIGHNRLVALTTTTAPSGLTSNGQAVSYTLSSDGTLLTATAGADHHKVFTVQLSDSGDGSYTFTLFDNIDHAAYGQNDDSLPLNFGFKATDSDGDSATGSFRVTVLDTSPVAHSGDSKTVDEDDLAIGTDSIKGSTTVGGSLNVAWGADDANPTAGGGLGDRSVAFRYSSAAWNVDAEDRWGHDLTLRSDGQTVQYAFENGVLVGYTGTDLVHGTRVFEVSLSDQDAGSYSFRLLGNLDHPAGSSDNIVNLSFDYTATDGDGDTSSSSFTVSVRDDVPVIGTPTGAALTENTTGAAGAEVFVTQTASNISLAINWGADDSNSGLANRSVAFASSIHTGDTVYTTGSGSPALTSNGVAVQFIRVSDTEIWGVANDNGGPLTLNDRKVFHITLSDSGSGSYNFELLDNVDHIGAGQGSALSLKLGFTATDSDGDPASGTFTVTINDDNGRPAIGAADPGTVDEDGLSGGNTAPAPGDVANADVTATGSLAISWGADDNNSGNVQRSVAFAGITNGQNASSDAGLLKIDNVQVKLWVVGTTLYGYTGSDPANGNTAPSAASQVFKVTLDDLGAGHYNFTLLQHVDHPTGQNENDIKLTFNYNATDADGDVSPNASFTVTFNDDSPVATSTVLTGAVYESELHTSGFSTGTQAGNTDNKNTDPNPDDTIFSGNLSSLVSIGADVPGSYSVETTALSSSLTSLTSGGVALTYTVSGNTLTAKAGLNVIFTFAVDANTGAYTFTLKGPLDNGTGHDASLALDLSTAVTAYDFDGDPVALHDQLLITVYDDAPTFTAANVLNGHVDEDGLGGNPGAPSPYSGTDWPGEATTASGGLGVNWGADSNNTGSFNRSLAFNGIVEGAVVVSSTNAAVTSHGQALHYHLTTIGGLPALVAYTGSDPSVLANQVFTVTLDDSSASGSYNFTLQKSLDHPVVNSEDDLTLKFGFTAKDADGDAVNGTFSVAVNDDSPIVNPAAIGNDAVDEDGLPGGNPGNSYNDGKDLTLTHNDLLATGSLGISYGADGPANVVVAPPTLTTINFDNFSNGSNGGNPYVVGPYSFTTNQGIANTTGHAGQLYGTNINLTDSAGPFTVNTLSLGLYGTSNNGTGEIRLTGVPSAGGSSIVVVLSGVATTSLGSSIGSFDLSSTALAGVQLTSLKIEPVLPGAHQFNGSVIVDNVALASGGGGVTDGPVTFTDHVNAANNVTVTDSNGHTVSLANLTSEGQAVKFALLDATTLVAYTGTTAPTSITGANVVFSTVLTGTGSGSYNFVLKAPLDHPIGGTEDNLVFAFAYTVKDFDGDTTAASFKVTVNDDSPIVGTIADQTVTEHTTDDYSNTFAALPQSLTGVSLNISWGADNGNQTNHAGPHDRSVAFTTSTAPADLTSNGYHLQYVVSADGQTLTAYRIGTGTNPITHQAETHYFNADGGDLGATLSSYAADRARVFAVTLSDGDPKGSYDFTLYSNLDQQPANGANSLPLNFGFVATDSDGDSVPGSFTVQVKDDLPVRLGNADVGNIDEGAVISSPRPSTSGHLAIDWNSDSAKAHLTFTGATAHHVDITDGNNHALTLTSGGVALAYTVRLAQNGVDQEVVAYKSTESVDNPVFVVTLNAQHDPAFAFTLFQPLDHSGAYDTNLPLTFGVTGYDGDGDPVTQSFTVNVKDSTPQSDDVDTVAIEEASGSVSTGAVDLKIAYGADGDSAGPSVTFLQAGPAYVHTQDGNPVSLTSLGTGLSYLLSADHTTLTAYRFDGVNYVGQNGASLGSNVANASDAAVFTVSLSEAGTGSYNFTLLQPIDHPAGTGSAQYLDLNFAFEIQDGDHDTFDNNFTVRIDAAGSITATAYTAPNSAVFVNLSDTPQTFDGQTVAAHTATDRASVIDKVVGLDRLGTIGQAFGGDGDDILIGGSGTNRLFGGAGNDTLIGHGGLDTIHGDAGNDTIIYTVGDGQDTVDGGADTDTQVIEGTAAAETFNINAIWLGGGTYLAANIDTTIAAATTSNFEVATTAVEEWVVNGNGGGDTFKVSGSLLGTGLATSTLKINGGDGKDTLDLSTYVDDIRVVSDGGADVDTVKFGFKFTEATYTKVFAADHTTLIGVNVTHNGVTDIFTNYESFVFTDGTKTLTGLFNTPPVAVGDKVTTDEDTVANLLTLLNNDSDVDHNPLTITGVSNPLNGTVTLDGNSHPVFTPAANFSGVAGFDYTVSDGDGGTATAHVTVDVKPVADAPVFTIAGGDGPTTPLANAGEFRINGFTDNNQGYPSIATLKGGGYVVTWMSANQDGNLDGIYAQRFDANNNPLGEFSVNLTTAGSQDGPSVAALDNGGFVIAWQTSSNGISHDIVARLYNASGVAGPVEINVATSGFDQTACAITALVGGGFVVTWDSALQDGSGSGVYGRIFDSSGTALSGEFPINQVTSGNQRYSSVATLNDGSFVVTWESPAEANHTIGVYARHFSATGVALSDEIHVNSYTSDTQYQAQVASLASGGFVVVWSSTGQDVTGRTSIYAQMFDSSGQPVGSETRISAAAGGSVQKYEASVVGLPDGGYVVMWNSSNQEGSGNNGVYAQRVGADGALLGNEFHVNESTGGLQATDPVGSGAPNLAVLGNGDLAMVWYGRPSASLPNSDEVYGRTFSLGAAAREDHAVVLPAITAAVTDTDGSETLRLLITGHPSGATFSVGHAGAGADAGKWVIDNATDIASLATHPLQMLPPPNLNGTYDLQVTAEVTDHAKLSDGIVHTDVRTTDPQTIHVDIIAVNDAPVANGDTGAVLEDQTLSVTAANGVILGTTGGSVADSDVDNATSSLVVSGVVAGTGTVTQGVGVGTSIAGAYGHLTLNADGSYSYVADNANALAAGVTAVDTFTYTDKDPSGAVSNATTLKITVTGTDDAPTAVVAGNGVNYTENEPFKVAVPNLTLGDADDTNLESAVLTLTNAQPGDRLWLGFTQLVQGVSGNLTISGATLHYAVTEANGGIAVTFSGSAPLQAYHDALQWVKYDSFSEAPSTVDRIISVTVNDGDVSSAPAISLIHVTEVNDPPVVSPASAQGNEDTVIAVSISGVDYDGSIASFKLASLAANGTLYSDSALTHALGIGSLVTATANGATVYFKPAADWNGLTSFTYGSIDDRGLESQSAATASITVNPVNDAPVVTITGTLGNIGDDYFAGYNAANGSPNLWTTDWTESGDGATSFNDGDIRVSTEYGGNTYLSFRDTDNVDAAVQRTLNLGGATSAILSFDYRLSGLDQADDRVLVQVSSDGVTFTTVGFLGGGTFDDPNYHNISFNISSFASANTTIRFVATAGLDYRDGSPYDSSVDLISIDNLNISYTLPGSISYTENGDPKAVLPNLTIGDVDDTKMESAAFKLVNAQAGDRLWYGAAQLSPGSSGDVTVSSGIVHYAVSTVGGALVVNLSGSATSADYQSLLKTITFDSASEKPSTVDRVVTVTVNDGDLNSNTATSVIHVTEVNDKPTASAASGSGNEDTAIAISLAGADVDGSVASFKIGSLTAFAGHGTLYSDSSLTHQLAANDLVTAAGNAATVYFKPAADWAGSTSFTYSAIDDRGATSAATASIVVSPVDDGKATLTLADTTQIATAPKVGDVLHATLGSDPDGAESNIAYHWLSDNQAITGVTAADYTLTSNDIGHQISVYATYTDGQGFNETTLTTTQTAAVITNNQPPVAQNDVYLGVDQPAPADLSSWYYNSSNGHYYKAVLSSLGWAEAKAAAEAAGGYLATITSQQENTFVVNVANTLYFADGHHYAEGVWLGGSDATSEGNWTWVTGPEAGQAFSYTNWNFREPNNGWGAGENDLLMWTFVPFGTWNDSTNSPSNSNGNFGYVVEYGGLVLPPKEDSAITIAAAKLLANDSDPDAGDSYSITSVQGANHGVVSLSSDHQTITFTPAANYAGAASFTYTITDSHGATSTATVSFNVAAVDDGVATLALADTTQTVTAPKVGDVLQATLGTDDPDGVASGIVYHWLSDGSAISAATAATYTLTSNDLGHQISVYATYTDGQGFADTTGTTNPTAVVISNNQPPVFGAGTTVGSVTEDASYAAASGNLILNGDFEYYNGNFYTLGAWTVGGAGAVMVAGGHTGGGSAYFYGGSSSLSQTINTVVGATYTIDFYALNSIVPMTVSVNGATVGTTGFNTDWTEQSFQFTATSTSSIIKFTGSQGISIDTIDVERGTPGTETVSGAIAFSDANALDTHSVVVTTPVGSSYYGSLSAAANDTTHQVNWSFSVNDSALQSLGVNDHINQVYTLTLNDGHGGTDTKTVVVTVNGTNDAPNPITDVDSGNNIVAETAAVGTKVNLTAFTTDPDAGDTVVYGLSDSAGGRFAIDSATGVVTVASALDYEYSHSHDIVVTATDSHGAVRSDTFTIDVANVLGDTNNTYERGFGFSSSISDTNGGNDRVVLDTSGVEQSDLNFLHSGNNLNITFDDGNQSPTSFSVTKQFSGQAVEYLNFDGGATLDGYALGDGAYNLATGLTRGAGNDIIAGTNQSSGSETLSGGAGNDLLFGNSGNDILIGGTGRDLLVGGSGTDTFKWNSGDADGSVDMIVDFQTGFGGDVIDLSGLLSSLSTSGRADHVRFEDVNGLTRLASASGTSALADGDLTLQVNLSGNAWTDVAVIHDTGPNLHGGQNDVINMILNSSQIQVNV